MTKKDTKKRKKTGGRVKGVPNKATSDAKAKMEELDCDPIKGMARLAMLAECRYIVDPEDPEGPPILNPDHNPVLSGNMYKELAQYRHPKLQSIAHTGADGAAIQLFFSSKDGSL